MRFSLLCFVRFWFDILLSTVFFLDSCSPKPLRHPNNHQNPTFGLTACWGKNSKTPKPVVFSTCFACSWFGSYVTPLEDHTSMCRNLFAAGIDAPHPVKRCAKRLEGRETRQKMLQVKGFIRWGCKCFYHVFRVLMVFSWII